MLFSKNHFLHLKKLIASASIEAAIKEIFQIFEAFEKSTKSTSAITHTYNHFVLTSQNYEKLKKQLLEGVTHMDQNNIENNKIVKNLLSILDDLELLSLKQEEKDFTNPSQSNQLDAHKISPRLYIPSFQLKTAFETAVNLGQPLLISGERGTGKSLFAHYVSHYLRLDEPFVINVKKSSSVKNLFYQYDEKAYVALLEVRKERLSLTEQQNYFVKYTKLGEAIKNNKRIVVLIDGIDNASWEYQNDLIDKIQSLSFEVEETGLQYSISFENRPIVIMVTNSENNLSDFLLRRCVYYHIPYPTKEELIYIILNIFSVKRDELFLRDAIDLFVELRSLASAIKPSTEELIAWINTLISLDIYSFDDKSADNESKILSSLSVIFKTNEDLIEAKRFYSN